MTGVPKWTMLGGRGSGSSSLEEREEKNYNCYVPDTVCKGLSMPNLIL